MTILPPATKRFRRDDGQAAVEFVLVVPLLAVLLFAIVQFGVAFHDYVAITDGSRVGARRAAVSRLVGDNGRSAEIAANEAAGLDGDVVSCTSTDWTKTGSDVQCTVSYDYSIDLMGWVIVSGTMTSKTTERLE